MWAPEEGWSKRRSVPGAARLEDLAHGASASGLLEGTDCITHGGRGEDEEGQRATRRGEAGKNWTAGRRLEKGARVFVLRREGKKANACGSCSRS